MESKTIIEMIKVCRKIDQEKGKKIIKLIRFSFVIVGGKMDDDDGNCSDSHHEFITAIRLFLSLSIRFCKCAFDVSNSSILA